MSTLVPWVRPPPSRVFSLHGFPSTAEVRQAVFSVACAGIEKVSRTDFYCHAAAHLRIDLFLCVPVDGRVYGF